MPLLRYLLFTILTFAFTIANGEISKTNNTVYEDGDFANGWRVYDAIPVGPTTKNIFDTDSGSHVIELLGDGQHNGFILGGFNSNDINAWDNKTQKVISWDAKFSEPVKVYISVQTTDGFRYLFYTDTDTDRGILNINNKYIHHGIGSNLKNGKWHTINRDLEADLHDFEPTNQIVSVNGFLVRGNSRFDNIEMMEDASSRNLFVAPAPNGSDTHDGSSNSPFATITYASTQSKPGDRIYIKAGVYKERVLITKSGTSDKPISYIGESGTIIQGKNESWWNWDGLFDIKNQSYIHVSGLQVINSKWAGISIDRSQGIKVTNNKTENSKSSGIYVSESNNITIDGNIVTGACNGGTEEAISVVTSDHIQVSNNNVHHSGTGENNNGGEGIDIKNGSHHVNVFHNHVHDNPKIGIYVDAWSKPTSNIKVYSNRVHKIDANGIVVASEMGGKVSNVSIYNNIVYDNTDSGITIGGRDWRNDDTTLSTPMENIKLINNTVYKNEGTGIYISNQDAKNVVVRNNISSQNADASTGQIEVSGTTKSIDEITIDHNFTDGVKQVLIWNTDTEKTNYLNSHLNADPLFIKPEAGDFRLNNSESPAIDEGSVTDAPTNDFDGLIRPQGRGLDIGAFEYRWRWK